MALILEDVAIMEVVLAEATGDDGLGPLIESLRRRLPGLLCMRCDASDVLEEPWRSYPWFDVHLVDASSHCTAVTTDIRRASGLLLAQKVAI